MSLVSNQHLWRLQQCFEALAVKAKDSSPEETCGKNSALGESIGRICATAAGYLHDAGECHGPDRKTTFVVAVAGGFSSGKSSFLNAVIGENICPVDTEITTKANTKFIYGTVPAYYRVEADGLRVLSAAEYQNIVQSKPETGEPADFEIRLPNKLLEKFTFLDTPGRGADDEPVDVDGDVRLSQCPQYLTDDMTSNRACEAADCIIYLSHPGNIKGEEEGVPGDKEFLLSEVARSRPVLVVMPQVDGTIKVKGKAETDQLVAKYQEEINALREENPQLSPLYCIGGFGRKNVDPEMRRDSLKKLFDGLDVLYRRALAEQERRIKSIADKRQALIEKVAESVSELSSKSEMLRVTPAEIAEFEHNFLSQNKDVQSRLIAMVNGTMEHFQKRPDLYCYRAEYNFFVNHAAIRTEAIKERMKLDVDSLFVVLKADAMSVFSLLKSSNLLRNQVESHINDLKALVEEYVGNAVHYWEEGANWWPGDTWYWDNDDVDKVGRVAVKQWAATQCANLILLMGFDVRIRAGIASIRNCIDRAKENHYQIWREQEALLLEISAAIDDFNKTIKDCQHE